MARLFRMFPVFHSTAEIKLITRMRKNYTYNGKSAGLKPGFLRSDPNSALTISVALDHQLLLQLLY